jgi:hypothetical protein
MDSIQVETRSGTVFAPGETVQGTVSWQLDTPAKTVELRLFWYTTGKGDQDVGVVSTVPFPSPAQQDQRSFSISLPSGPYSFSGSLISLLWALEAVAEPGARAGRVEILVSPTRQEIVLSSGISPSR